MSEPENAEIGEIRPGPPVPEGWPSCRVCGCWEYNACPDEDFGACWWVEPDLCSACADVVDWGDFVRRL